MKKLRSTLICVMALLSLTACGKAGMNSESMEPKTSQMKAICELAVMDCYYHNVAKFTEEDAEGFLLWKKDKNFWIEYSGVVTLGIDASLVKVEVSGSEVSITIPSASVSNCTVDSSSLTEDSFIVAKNSAKIQAEDEVYAFEAAQTYLEQAAADDTALLASAQQRAQELLEEYITNIGKAVGQEYTIKWIYLDDSSESIDTEQTPAEEPET